MTLTCQQTRPSKPLPLAEPRLAGREWEYVKECLDTGWVSSVGSFVDRFESAIAERVGVPYAVATSSGSAALHLALLAAGVQPNDEVIVSTLSFIAPANAIRYVGAHPVFIDADANTWQIDPARIETFLSSCESSNGRVMNRRSGRRVRAILPVHIMGHPVDLREIRELAARFQLTVIEDAAEGLGALYREVPVGSTDQIAILSFNGNKIMTTGGGGMVLTSDPQWAKRIRYLSTQAKDDPVEYVHHEIGFNYRLTNVQAAIGCAQLEQLEQFIASKRRIADIYREELCDVAGITLMPEAPWARSTFWLYTVLVDADNFGMDSRELAARLSGEGIQTRPLWQPIHKNRPFRGSEVIGGKVAEKLWRESISLPCSCGMDDSDVRRVASVIRSLAR